jgi:exonuclease V gamma subunit
MEKQGILFSLNKINNSVCEILQTISQYCKIHIYSYSMQINNLTF